MVIRTVAVEPQAAASGSGNSKASLPISIEMKPDVHLQRELFKRLQGVPKIDLAAVGIIATDGIVTVSGRVPSRSEKWSVIHAVECVPGVKAIVDEIRVESRGDGDIACAVVNALKSEARLSNLPQDNIKVLVRNGWVRLKGVAAKSQKTAIENAVRKLAGIRGLSNHITVNPTLVSEMRHPGRPRARHH